MGRKFAAVVFSLGCLQASSALALGLGELKLESNLNEPLEASVDLLNIDGLHEDEIRIRLGTREDFKRLGLERTFFLTSIQFEVVVGDGGRPRILMRTDDPVLEPYLDFIVEARWPSGRLLREYTVLIDPPAFAEATPVVSASERVEQVEGIPAPTKKKVEEGAGSGTRVDIRKSDLEPGEMPARDFNAAAADAPRPGSRYMIARDDTLWEIASKAKPQGASVHQTMLDIQRLNPDAFIDNNINRVKAGYIVYLPSSDDISSADLATALAEVREQNAAWREGRDTERVAGSGPSLRISADPEEAPSATAEAGAAQQHRAGAAVQDDLAATSRELEDAAGRLASLEQQVETLQRIVDLKDDQIAALQSALAEQDSGADVGEASSESDLMPEPGEALATPPEVTQEAVAVEDAEVEAEAEAEAMAEPEAVAAPAPRPAPGKDVQASGGIMDYLWYIVGAVLLGLVGLFVARRRSAGDDGDEGVEDDVFSDVQLREPDIAVEREAVVAAEPAEPAETPVRDSRGYGERKHDAYASDVEAADALAEADIYIAYGRHQQAIDLLNNALASEPDNPVYRLKLLEIHTELNNRPAAQQELDHIRASGDADSIARGEELLAGLDAAVVDAQVEAEPAPAEPDTAVSAQDSPGLTPNPLELMEDSSEDLETEFSGLEIESDTTAEDEEELDLSADFEGEAPADDEDEELVIAEDANGMSTKLDLARAYLDMGDEDGARQILAEVVAEGSDELKAEAQSLLDRIG
ncbi:MAG: hypothetical protein CME59_11735 [Halioglobus sp.]|nr:hypothetical protein [Halioglobus sp.]